MIDGCTKDAANALVSSEVGSSLCNARHCEEEVVRRVPFCWVVESCVDCGRLHPAYGKRGTPALALNRTLPGEALNHQMSGETLNTQPSATTKNINPSAKKSNINLLAQAMDEASVRNDNEKLPPPPLFLLFISQISVKFLVIIFLLSSFVGPRILINDHLIGFSLVVAMFVLVSVLTMTRSGLLFLLGARILLLVLPISVLLVTVLRNVVKPGSVSMGMLVEESPLLPFCSHC